MYKTLVWKDTWKDSNRFNHTRLVGIYSTEKTHYLRNHKIYHKIRGIQELLPILVCSKV